MNMNINKHNNPHKITKSEDSNDSNVTINNNQLLNIRKNQFPNTVSSFKSNINSQNSLTSKKYIMKGK